MDKKNEKYNIFHESYVKPYEKNLKSMIGGIGNHKIELTQAHILNNNLSSHMRTGNDLRQILY